MTHALEPAKNRRPAKGSELMAGLLTHVLLLFPCHVLLPPCLPHMTPPLVALQVLLALIYLPLHPALGRWAWALGGIRVVLENVTLLCDIVPGGFCAAPIRLQPQ